MLSWCPFPLGNSDTAKQDLCVWEEVSRPCSRGEPWPKGRKGHRFPLRKVHGRPHILPSRDSHHAGVKRYPSSSHHRRAIQIACTCRGSPTGRASRSKCRSTAGSRQSRDTRDPGPQMPAAVLSRYAVAWLLLLLLRLGYCGRSRTRRGNEQANLYATILFSALASLVVSHRLSIAGTQCR